MPGMWYELENIFGKDGIEIGVLFPTGMLFLDEILFDRQICLFLRWGRGRARKGLCLE